MLWGHQYSWTFNTANIIYVSITQSLYYNNKYPDLRQGFPRGLNRIVEDKGIKVTSFPVPTPNGDLLCLLLPQIIATVGYLFLVASL